MNSRGWSEAKPAGSRPLHNFFGLEGAEPQTAANADALDTQLSRAGPQRVYQDDE